MEPLSSHTACQACKGDLGFALRKDGITTRSRRCTSGLISNRPSCTPFFSHKLDSCFFAGWGAPALHALWSDMASRRKSTRTKRMKPFSVFASSNSLNWSGKICGICGARGQRQRWCSLAGYVDHVRPLWETCQMRTSHFKFLCFNFKAKRQQFVVGLRWRCKFCLRPVSAIPPAWVSLQWKFLGERATLSGIRYWTVFHVIVNYVLSEVRCIHFKWSSAGPPKQLRNNRTLHYIDSWHGLEKE